MKAEYSDEEIVLSYLNPMIFMKEEELEKLPEIQQELFIVFFMDSVSRRSGLSTFYEKVTENQFVKLKKGLTYLGLNELVIELEESYQGYKTIVQNHDFDDDKLNDYLRKYKIIFYESFLDSIVIKNIRSNFDSFVKLK